MMGHRGYVPLQRPRVAMMGQDGCRAECQIGGRAGDWAGCRAGTGPSAGPGAISAAGPEAGPGAEPQRLECRYDQSLVGMHK